MKKIVCPNCGAEYLPAEIYLPNSFFGRPRSIDKTPEGKIMHFSGPGLDSRESYKCDYCNKKFTINASINFHTECSKIQKHTTKIQKPRLFMCEE